MYTYFCPLGQLPYRRVFLICICLASLARDNSQFESLHSTAYDPTRDTLLRLNPNWFVRPRGIPLLNFLVYAGAEDKTSALASILPFATSACCSKAPSLRNSVWRSIHRKSVLWVVLLWKCRRY